MKSFIVVGFVLGLLILILVIKVEPFFPLLVIPIAVHLLILKIGSDFFKNPNQKLIADIRIAIIDIINVAISIVFILHKP